MSTPEENATHVDVPPISISAEEASAFLLDLFGLWERGKVAVEAGYRATPEAWSKIIARHNQYAAMIAIKAMETVAAPLSKAVSGIAFAEGLKQGEAQAQTRRRSAPALPGRLPALPGRLPALDSEAIVRIIGEELRKMFDAGLAQGKSATDAVIEAGKLAKPSGEIVKVQRNGAGEIVGAVKELVYNGNAGV